MSTVEIWRPEDTHESTHVRALQGEALLLPRNLQISRFTKCCAMLRVLSGLCLTFSPAKGGLKISMSRAKRRVAFGPW